jgi:hypothetical protein
MRQANHKMRQRESQDKTGKTPFFVVPVVLLLLVLRAVRSAMYVLCAMMLYVVVCKLMSYVCYSFFQTESLYNYNTMHNT